jgi:hypothetical protein
MITKTKAALAAVLVLGSASTAFAVNVTANADRAPSGYYVQAAPASDVYARAQANEVRAAGPRYEYSPRAFEGRYPTTSDQQHWLERAPIDFNS